MSEHTTDAPRPGTHHPHLARERALKVLFAADVRGVDARLLLDEVATSDDDLELLDELEPDQEQVAGDEDLQFELTRRRRLPVDGYTRDLVAGVASRRPAIDDLLGDVADRWPVHRMPALDRNLLRLAVYELAEQDTPPAVVIDEAVSLAIAFAGEKARGFVNGVLETVRQRVAAGEVTLASTITAVPTEPSAEVDAVDDEVEATVAAPPEEQAPTDAEQPADDVDPAARDAYDVALGLLDGDEDGSGDPAPAIGDEGPVEDLRDEEQDEIVADEDVDSPDDDVDEDVVATTAEDVPLW